MKQYLDLVQNIFDNGSWQENRTGTRSLSVPGAMLRFDLTAGFPAVTTKKLAFKSAIGELIGFIRGARSAAEFRELGCKVWDQNANQNKSWLSNPYRLGYDDLGPVYGVQWREWPAYKVLDLSSAGQIEDAECNGFTRLAEFEEGGLPKLLLYKAIDQLRQCLDSIIRNPTDRRIIFHAWNCAQLDEMALPPCHLLYQFMPNAAKRELSLCLYVRSNDVGLGTPFNLTEGAALLHVVGRLTGFTPRWFTYFIGDAHIYENHFEMLKEQLSRVPYPSPQLSISSRVPDFSVTGQYEPHWLEAIAPEDFALQRYQHHGPLTAPMAV